MGVKRLLTMCDLRLLPLILLIAISSNVLANGNYHWQKTPFILDSFYETALGSEFGNASLRVIKWKKPVNIYVEHQVKDVELHNALLNAHISDLREVTGLNIKRVKQKGQSNIKLYFTSRNKLAKLMRRESGPSSLKHIESSVCLVSVRSNRLGEIQNAIIYIPVDQARIQQKLVSCIVEELTQALGLPRDSDKVFPSIFNDKSINQNLTGLDVILLKLLYSPRVLPGMNKTQLKPILSQYVNRMRKKGVIQKAALYARSLSMCEYLDC